MRLIDADRLLSDRMKSMYYHLPNGDIAIPIIDIEHAPTIKKDITDDYMDGWDDAINAIRTRKFEIEPWQGEWIGAGFLTSECSRCHHLFHELEAMNFCPHCGADMRKEK